MAKPPCIRGLNTFKKGCPCFKWSQERPDGCPAWIEIAMLTRGGTDRIEIKECVDLYMARLQFSTNCLLEGNQQAIESFRNNMTVDGSPKPDPALMMMLEHVQQRKSIGM